MSGMTSSGRDHILKIGTRGSLLARTQTDWCAQQIQAGNPGLTIDIVVIQTTGDLRRDVPFAQVGTKGMFVKEIEQALLDGSIDVGVHSLKDMPAQLPEGLELGCVPMRENPYDALCSRGDVTLKELRLGAVIGTSSIRRQAQLRAYRQDLRLVELRGNLDTRLRKLQDGEMDAIVVAAAGLNRLGWTDKITETLAPSVCVPAAGQGALALETRIGDSRTNALLAVVNDADAADTALVERSFLAALGGGCSVPAAAHAQLSHGALSVTAIICAPDGSGMVRAEDSDERAFAANLGERVAHRLLHNGGSALLQR